MGSKFAPRGEVKNGPLGVNPLLFKRMEGRTDNFNPREQNSPWGTTLPWVQSFPLGVRLRVGLRWFGLLGPGSFLSRVFKNQNPQIQKVNLEE
jgi:hypothetical protein